MGSIGQTPAPAEVVRLVVEAWNARDVEGAVGLWAPDAIYDASERVLNPDVYRGHDDLRRFVDEVSQLWSSFQIQIEHVIELGPDRVLALMRSTGEGRSSGVKVEETDSATLWTIRDGQVVFGKLFMARAKAFEEVGLPYPFAG